jgi:hypothetical protein
VAQSRKLSSLEQPRICRKSRVILGESDDGLLKVPRSLSPLLSLIHPCRDSNANSNGRWTTLDIPDSGLWVDVTFGNYGAGRKVPTARNFAPPFINHAIPSREGRMFVVESILANRIGPARWFTGAG